MSKEVKPKKPRSTKKDSDADSNVAELEAKIAQLEARLAGMSSQVKPAETRPAQTSTPPPKTRPAASGPTHGTLPAGMKPAPKPQPEPQQTYQSESEFAEVAPAYSKLSSTGYTGNKYYATRARLAYHPPNKQYTGSETTSTTTTSSPPPAPQPEPQRESRGTLPAGTKPQEKKSLWKAKGADVAETYTPQPEHRPPPPSQPSTKPSRGTLPAGFKSTPPPAPKPEPAQQPKPEPAKPRPAASGPTHGTLPAGMKPAPKPEVVEKVEMPQDAGEISPAYATISSSGYTGNRYYATRARLAYHPPNKQYTGSGTSSTTAPPPPEPPKVRIRKGTLPAGFKPSS